MKRYEASVQALVAKAKAGGQSGIKILFDRTIGKATPAFDPDRLEVEELTLAREIKQAQPSRLDFINR